MNGNVSELKKWLENPSGQFLLESFSNPKHEKNKIWLSYAAEASAILLIRRIVDSTEQNFNHIIFDEEAIQQYKELIPTIIDDALTQIESGKCWRFSPTTNLQYHFVEEKNCQAEH